MCSHVCSKCTAYSEVRLRMHMMCTFLCSMYEVFCLCSICRLQSPVPSYSGRQGCPTGTERYNHFLSNSSQFISGYFVSLVPKADCHFPKYNRSSTLYVTSQSFSAADAVFSRLVPSLERCAERDHLWRRLAQTLFARVPASCLEPVLDALLQYCSPYVHQCAQQCEPF